MFAAIKIKCSISIVFGLRKLSDLSEDAIVILPIDTISRALAQARTNSDIWILNASL